MVSVLNDTIFNVMTLYIKNMVCPRCITSVKEVFESEGIVTSAIRLGEVDVEGSIDDKSKHSIQDKLEVLGFELLEDANSTLIAQIKAIIVDEIHHKEEKSNVNFSTLIAEKTNHDYSALSKLFSSVEGVTIEKYILHQKVEKVKELIHYNELTLSEIAFQLNYSSVAHLSSQFKKETGMTPSAFKKLNINDRKNLDEV